MGVAMLVDFKEMNGEIKMRRFNKFVPAHTKELKLYDFDELTEDAKEHVRECKHEYLFGGNPWFDDEFWDVVRAVSEKYGFDYGSIDKYDELERDIYIKRNSGECEWEDIKGARAYTWLENNIFNDLRVKPKIIMSTFPAEGYEKITGVDGSFKDGPFTGTWWYDNEIYEARKRFIKVLRTNKNISVYDFWSIFFALIEDDFRKECEYKDSDDFIDEWEGLAEIEGYEKDGTPWTWYDVEKAGYLEKDA